MKDRLKEEGIFRVSGMCDILCFAWTSIQDNFASPPTRVGEVPRIRGIQRVGLRDAWHMQSPSSLGIPARAGSVKRIKELCETLEEEESGGSRRADLDASDIHTVGGVLKKTLIAIEPPLVPDEVVSTVAHNS